MEREKPGMDRPRHAQSAAPQLSNHRRAQEGRSGVPHEQEAGSSPASSQAPASPPRRVPADIRTIRILQVLSARTDEHIGLSATQIREALKEPENPDLPSIEANRGAIRQSIMTLRAAGFSIHGERSKGYSLRSRPLDEACIDLIVRALRCSRVLSAGERNRCIRQVIKLAPITQRTRLLGELKGIDTTETTGSAETTMTQRATHVYTYRLESVAKVVRRAICDRLPISFECSDEPRIPHAPHAERHDEPDALKRFGTRRAIVPDRIVEHAGAAYLCGRAERAQRGMPVVEQTVRFDRMAHLACVDSDKTIHIAFGAAWARQG